MFNNKNKRNQIEQNSEEKSEIEILVSQQKTEDRYILDDEDAIIVIHSDEDNEYIMVHERLIDGKLVEINRWPIRSYYFGSIHDVTPIREFNLFQVQNNWGEFNALYDYKKGIFVVPQGTWKIVDSGCNNSLLKKYGGFLASFSISSDYEEGDLISYENPITGEKLSKYFGISDGNYYAILELDGTIRGNKLFKGDSFSKITEIIDLDQYESLEELKKERKHFCNETRTKRKQEYYQMIESRNDGSISPYLDTEVAKIINLKK